MESKNKENGDDQFSISVFFCFFFTKKGETLKKLEIGNIKYPISIPKKVKISN